MQTITKRSDIPKEYTWNLESIFPTNDDWEHAYKSLQQRIPGLEALQGTLTQSGAALLKVFEKRDELVKDLETLFVYASMRKDEDTTNSLYQSMADRAMQIYVRVSTASSFIEPEILSVPQETLEQFMQEAPGLKLYEHQLHDLNRQRAHIRSAEIEAILASAGEIAESPDTIFAMIDNADMKLPMIKNEHGEEVALTKGNYQVFIRHPNREVRKAAFEALHTTFMKQRNTLGATLYSQIKSTSFFTRQRGYQSNRERALSAHNIPESVYDMLVETVSEYIPLLNRYLKLRKKLLKLDELHMYDLYVPIIEERETHMTYEQARDIVLSALAPLGSDYVNTLKKAFSDRWIDVYETPGKRGGAYSGGSYTTLPFILLNFQNNRDSMYTLAHELGHSMHSFFTRSTQPYPYGDYTIFVAEVASTLNEGLLTEYLLQTTTDKALRLAILNHSLEDFRGTLFRQTMFAEFEQQIHSRAEAGEPMTADTLSEIYRALNQKYYGAEVQIDDLIDIEWARIPHFYSSFYVYQYATGISAASALVRRITTEGQPAVERYLNFLKSGGSDYSIELLKKAGVDMTSHEPVRQAFKLFESYLSQMEELLA
ncbi:MAG TPA: oligoendopeptidase F [Ktedonobacteraceae bacterium]|nr:oligoendopeptidase F [Ktedonobacteraceae bacterium]